MQLLRGDCGSASQLQPRRDVKWKFKEMRGIRERFEQSFTPEHYGLSSS
jgi:hypothetical protein